MNLRELIAKNIKVMFTGERITPQQLSELADVWFEELEQYKYTDVEKALKIYRTECNTLYPKLHHFMRYMQNTETRTQMNKRHDDYIESNKLKEKVFNDVFGRNPKLRQIYDYMYKALTEYKAGNIDRERYDDIYQKALPSLDRIEKLIDEEYAKYM